MLPPGRFQHWNSCAQWMKDFTQWSQWLFVVAACNHCLCMEWSIQKCPAFFTAQAWRKPFANIQVSWQSSTSWDTAFGTLVLAAKITVTSVTYPQLSSHVPFWQSHLALFRFRSEVPLFFTPETPIHTYPMAEVAQMVEIAPSAAADDRIRMECDKCGYKCVPQWLNDKAHCLKCQAVLRSRNSLHEAKREILGAEANGEDRRQAGEVSTFKAAPNSAMESASGSCSKAPDGVHHWKYGKCNFCQQAEGKLAKGPGVMQNPGGVGECQKGGKCMFKFAKCTKCGRGELAKGEREDVRRISDASTASSGTNNSKSPRTQVTQPTQPRAQSPPLAAAAGLLMKDTKSEEEVTKKFSKESKDSESGKSSKGETRKTSKGGTDDRTRMTCHVCGYKSVPQWLNDKAHCLKCDAILKTPSSKQSYVKYTYIYMIYVIICQYDIICQYMLNISYSVWLVPSFNFWWIWSWEMTCHACCSGLIPSTWCCLFLILSILWI